MSTIERESLAEDLLLLALHNERGTAHLKEEQLRSALAAATVMDLLLGGKIAATGGEVIVVDRSPTNDPVRDHALRCVGASKMRTPLSACGGMIETGMPDIATRLREQLVARGVLQRRSYRRIGLLPAPDHYPERDGRIEQDVRAKLCAVALHDAEPDARTATLAALVARYRLDAGLFSDEERPLAQAQLRAIARQLHDRAPSSVPAAASGIAANAQAAGGGNVSGNAFVGFLSDEGIGSVFELIFDILPTLIGGLLQIFDS